MTTSERAEHNLIMAIIEDPECMKITAGNISPDDFQYKTYSDIYAFCLESYANGDPFGPDIIIQKKGDWQKVVCERSDFPVISANIHAYINAVLEASRLRQIKKAARRLQEQENYNEAIKEIEKLNTLSVGLEEANLKLPAAYPISKFMKEVESRSDQESISTGFHCFDNVLGGGLYPGLFVVSGMSAVGKTTFMLQLACNLARNGNNVIYFTLEQSVYELQGKILSRLAYEISGENEKGEVPTAREITSGKMYKYFSTEKQRLIDEAMKDYGQNIEKNIFWHEGSEKSNIDNITNAIKVMQKRIVNPIIIIDYLQIITPANDRQTDKQNTDQAVTALRRLSRDLKIPILVISSLNRSSYSEGVSLGSFKESGSIEYSADVAIGLQLSGNQRKGNKAENLDDLLKMYPRPVEACILKNRNGHAGEHINLSFYPDFNYYAEKREFIEENNLWKALA